MKNRQRHFFTVPIKGGALKLDAGELYYLESQGHRLVFHTAGGDHISAGSMGEWEEKLVPLGFFRSNKGYLLNLEHVDGFTAVTNPLVNSYKRLSAGYEAPRYKAWSASNRSTLIRIPAIRGHATRVELRSPDPSCNPYLAVAVCLAAGLDGIARNLTPPPDISDNLYDLDDGALTARNIGALPETLKDALDAMERDELVMDVLGQHVAEHYIRGKRKEWREYQSRVSNWELEKYLVTY